MLHTFCADQANNLKDIEEVKELHQDFYSAHKSEVARTSLFTGV